MIKTNSDCFSFMCIKTSVCFLLCLILLISCFPICVSGADTLEASDRIIVAMGDSFSSGEGIEPFFDQSLSLSTKLTNQNWLAHRSENAWSGMLTLPTDNGRIKMSDNKNNWRLVAMSGAVTGNITETEQIEVPISKKDKKEKWYRFKHYRKIMSTTATGFPTKVDQDYVVMDSQIDVFKQLRQEGKKADYVTLTMGGNDAGFTDIVIDVVMTSSYMLDSNYFYKRINYIIENKLPAIERNLYDCYSRILEEAGEQAHLIVVGYPHLFDKNGHGFFVSKHEATIVNNAITIFNIRINSVVRRLNYEMRKNNTSITDDRIHFVAVEDAFDNHEAYSDTNQITPFASKQAATLEEGEFINRLCLGAQKQDIDDFVVASAYSIHPNLRGANAYAKCVQATIDELENRKSGSNEPDNKPTANVNQSLQTKLDELISEYGVASDETYTANTNVISNKSWTHREGVVSAKLSDLDGDAINELVVVRLIGGDLNPYSEALEFSVYYYAPDGVKSAGTISYFTGDDFTQKDIDSFIRRIGNRRYIFIETDFGMYATDGSAENAYTVLEYSNQKLFKKLRVSYEENYSKETNYNFTSAWIETTWDGDVENEREIYYNGYDGNDFNNRITRGDYKDSEKPVKDYFVDFGLSSTDDVFPLSRMVKFFNSDKTEKLFEFVLSRGPDLTKYTSSLTDYTGLDHSKASTSAEKVDEWKELYVNYFSKQENKSILDYASFNIVDVDEDGTPELVYTGFAAMGTHMIWIKDGEVQDQAIGYGDFKYIPSDNLVYCHTINHGIYSDNVLSFQNKKLTQVFSGQILPKENGFENPGWSVNGKDVSESEYNRQLNDSFDFTSAKSLNYESVIQGSELINKIKKY